MKTKLILKNDIVEIERLAGWVRSFGREHDLPEKLVWEIRLVLEEVVTNIISHGYADRAAHAIEISMVNSERDITLSVRDDAQPFNLLNHSQPDLETPLEDRGVGGMGVHIVREIMDEIDYQRKADGNLVVMRRYKH